MAERSIFDLDPDQLDRLLSIGNDAIKKQNEKGQETSADQAHERPDDKPDLSGPERSGNSTASCAAIVERPGGWIGKYKLLSVLGEGGMGIVYLAEQERPIKRHVALKVVKPGMDSKRVIARFEAERQALALLDHPNIASVHDAGTTQTGRPYFVMEYVKGVSITEYCDREKLDIEARLGLFLQVCEAVQYAHQKGIIHRDIKPSNIQVTIHGEKAVPKIIDFGVAKALSQLLTERTLVTEQGQMVGTPEYMSPEQAEMTNQDIDSRTDIYSLGVVLYELLSGTLPFDPQTLREAGVEAMRRMIRERDPKTPSTRLLQLQAAHKSEIRYPKSKIKNDLDWITLKAMDKDRTRRYQTAHALAEDIQRYLNQEPVLAGPPSTTYKLRKFVMRNKALFVSTAAIAIVVVLAAVISMVLAIKAIRAEREENEQRLKAEAAQGMAEKAQKDAEDLAKQQELDLYFNHIQLAHQELQDNRPMNAIDYLSKCPEELRNWEWHYLRRKSYSQEAPSLEFDDKVNSFDLSPDGSKLAAFCLDGKLVIRDRVTRKETFIQVRKNLQQLADDHKSKSKYVAFCPDGKHIAVAGDDFDVNLISLDSYKTIRHLDGHSDTVLHMAWAPPEGSLLATISKDRSIRLWDRHSGDQVKVLAPHWTPTALTFSGDGQYLVICYHEARVGRFNVQDVLDGQKAKGDVTFLGMMPVEISVSPNGRHIATALWNGSIILSSGEYAELARFEAPPKRVADVAFNSDGTRLASINDDLTVRLWDVITGREILAIRQNDPALIHGTISNRITFGSDDHELFVGDRTRTLKILDASPLAGTQNSRSVVLSGRHYWASTVDFSPSGHQVVSSDAYGNILFSDISDGRQVSIIDSGYRFDNPQFSPNGQWITAVYWQGGQYYAQVWDAVSPHEERFSTKPSNRYLIAVTLSHDNKYLVTGGEAGELYVYDWQSDIMIGVLGQQDSWISDITASPDGKHLASTGRNGSVKIWDATHLDEAQEEGRLMYEGGIGRLRVRFSPDSKYLAVGGSNTEIRILDVESGETHLSIPYAHGDKVHCVCFSPNGKYLASGSSDETARIWDVETGKPVDVLLGYEGPIFSIAFSPNGKHVACAGGGENAIIWTPRFD